MKLLEKILLPIDIDSVNENQFKIAGELAKKFNSRLEFIYVLPSYAHNKTIEKKVEKAIKNEFDVLKNKYLDESVEVNYIVKYGNLFDQIMEIAEDINVNLILFGNRLKKNDEAYKLGLNAEKIIRKSPKPVWITDNDFVPGESEILCPVDFSDAAKRALENAIQIARSFNLKLHIINVFESVAEGLPEKIDIELSIDEEKLSNENKLTCDQFLTKFDFSDVEYETKTLVGAPHAQIIDYIKNNNIALLFMGTNGKSMISRALMGSVTGKVAIELPCTMVTMKSNNILKVKIDSDISGIEDHYKRALQLEESGFYEEAINQLEICLGLSDLHIPSIAAIARLYKKTGDDGQAGYYNKKVDEILRRLWDEKVEIDIRKHFRHGI